MADKKRSREKEQGGTKKGKRSSKKAAVQPAQNKSKEAARKPESASSPIVKQVEQLAEALVFAELSDPAGLAQIHTQFEEISAWAAKNGQDVAKTAAVKSADLLEKVILRDVEDPEAALEVINKALSGLQEIIRDGRRAEDVEFPAQFSLGAAAAGGALSLPSNVDEQILAEFLGRQGSELEELESLILELEKGPNDEALGSLRGKVHTLKGESGLLGMTDVQKLCHSLEDLFDSEESQERTDILLAAKDWLSRVMTFYADGKAAPEGVAGLLGRIDSALGREAAVEAVAPAEEEPEEEFDDTPIPLEGDLDLLGDFVVESREHLEAADVHLLTLETEPREEEALNAVFRAFHTIKGVAGFLGLEEIGSLAHEAENLLDKARKGDVLLSGAAIDVTFDSVDGLKRMVDRLSNALSTGTGMSRDRQLKTLLRRIVAVGEGAALPPEPEDSARADVMLGDILVDTGSATEEGINRALIVQDVPPKGKRLGEILVENAMTSRKKIAAALEDQKVETGETRKLGDILVESSAARREDVDRALAKQQAGPTRPKLGEVLVKSGEAAAKDVAHALRAQRGAGAKAVMVKETVKVDADRLDRLVDTIGELVITEAMVTQSNELTARISSGLERHLRQLDKITRELQEMGTSLRMIPLRATFQKMARLARDLGRKSGKLVEFKTSGEETEIDKSVVDRIGDPLVHMVRNAVDHGIEQDPNERRRAGKPEAGHVELRAFHKGGSIYIEVADDGRGLNREAILAKAREKGIVTDGENMTDREVFNLVFAPGFSTAKQVTEVSGRGVGMDVVKKNIEALRGQCEISSDPGRGSVFTMRLPLTLAIIDGMVMRVGSERYIVPTLSVVRSVKPSSENLTSVLGKGEMLKIQEELLPLFRIDRLFGVRGALQDPTEAIAMVVEDENRRVALLIDELLGQQQIVIKSLGAIMKEVRGLSGGAIMPDGSVGLIVDVNGLVRMAHMEGAEAVREEFAEAIEEDEGVADGETEG